MSTAPLRTLYIPLHLVFGIGAAFIAARMTSLDLMDNAATKPGIVVIAIAAILTALPAMRGRTWQLTACAVLPWLASLFYTRTFGYSCGQISVAMANRERLSFVRHCVAEGSELPAIGAVASAGLAVATLLTMVIARNSHTGRLTWLGAALGALGACAAGVATHSLGLAGQLKVMSFPGTPSAAQEVERYAALMGRSVPIAMVVGVVAVVAGLLLWRREQAMPPPPKFGVVRGQGAIVGLVAATLITAVGHWRSLSGSLDDLSIFKPAPPDTIVLQPVLPSGAVASRAKPMFVGDVPVTEADITSTSPVVTIDAGIAPAVLAARLDELKPHTQSLQFMGVRVAADRLPVSPALQHLLYDDEPAVMVVPWCAKGGIVNDGTHTLTEIISADCIRFSR
jgi:hypothetical protein